MLQDVLDSTLWTFIFLADGSLVLLLAEVMRFQTTIPLPVFKHTVDCLIN